MPIASRILVLVALAGALAACSSGNDSTSPTAAAGSSTSARHGAPSSSTTLPSTTTTVPQTPLDKFLFGTPPPDTGMSAADLRDSRRVQQLTAECMHDEGFPYKIQEIDGSDSGPRSLGPYGLPPEEFARQYGYGISTITRSGSKSLDPNQPAIKAMSNAERAAYARALFGSSGITFDSDGVAVKPQKSPSGPVDNDFGCSGKASDAVYGKAEEQPAKEPTQSFRAIEQAMSDLQTRIENDPRSQAAMQAWTGCMADAGYPGLTDLNATTTVQQRFDQLTGSTQRPGRPPTTAHPADPAALRQLQAYEIAIATADYTCQVAYTATTRAVRIELENQFIAQHRAELEAYREAVKDGKAGNG
jgi:hypothetical protein